MPRGHLDLEEQTAGKIVAEQLGGTPVPRDVPGAPDGTHDLDIVIADGRRVPLEVTSAIDGETHAMVKLALGGSPAPSLAHHWWLGVPKDKRVRVKLLMKGVVAHLEVLEQQDVEQVGGALTPGKVPDGAPQAVVDAARGVFALGADRATRRGPPEDDEAALVMASVHSGGVSDFDQLNVLVAACAEAKVDKLIATGADERHLFVWMHDDDAALAMETLPPPVVSPMLPEGVDVVWVATGPTGDESLCRCLYRLEPSGGWETIDS